MPRYLFTPKMPLLSVLMTIAALLLFLLSLLGQYWLKAATSQFVDTPANPPVSTVAFEPVWEHRQDVDAALIIDFSGSMNGENGSDPQGLRLQAAELMAASLATDIYPRKTRMGYVIFATTAEPQICMMKIDSLDARRKFIEVVSQTLKSPPSELINGDFTNFQTVFNTAGAMLFPGDPSFPPPVKAQYCEQNLTEEDEDDENEQGEQDEQQKKNIPAVIFMTDGRPTRGADSKEEIIHLLEKFADRDAVIFAILLRNPHQVLELPEFTEWRQNWADIAKRFPHQVQYIEAKDASELEGIYNDIRGQLVNEGTHPGKRVSYDPSDPAAAIDMPPNLLQAHLLLGKPKGGQYTVTLTDPNGTTFADLEKQNDKNQLLDGAFYYRYKIAYPTVGKWKLQTNASGPIYYLLNVESKYYPRIYWLAGGAPYINGDVPTELPIVVTDENGQPTKIPFQLKATLVTQPSKPGDPEQLTPLQVSGLQPDGQTYLVHLTPDMLGPDNLLTMELDGAAQDGTLLNLARLSVAGHLAPDGVKLVLPPPAPCQAPFKNIHFYPPRIDCSNAPKVRAVVQGSDRLASQTLSGALYPPGQNAGQAMRVVDAQTLEASIGPLTSAGRYGVTVDVAGQLAEQVSPQKQVKGSLQDPADLTLKWVERRTGVVEIGPPAWAATWQHRFQYGTWLFLILALWKPVIVALLLPLFKRLRAAPVGCYSEDTNISPGETYEIAMKRRKLFTLTVGMAHTDIIAYESDNIAALPSSWRDRFLYAQPCSRLLGIPFVGLYVDDCNGVRQISDVNYTTVSCRTGSIFVGRHDWTQPPDFKDQ